MRRLKAFFLVSCFCIPLILLLAGCGGKREVYREKVIEDQKVEEEFVVE